jgi:3-methyl-2-oxobutanoate hydroxymethyltransferase
MKTVLDFQKMKNAGQKISMATCYDYSSARILNSSKVDCILVGDSVVMTIHGNDNTLDATSELMALHISAVRKGAPDKFIVGDMPFLAHRGSLDRTMEAVRLIMKSGAQAIKIEGVEGSESTIRHIVESGVPVMGHLGLTPQSVHQLGGFKVQGTGPDAFQTLMSQARKLQECGTFSLVLEAIPAEIAARVSKELMIPTIGIGAGSGCGGQVLVWQDLLGMNTDFKPKFVRRYLQGSDLIRDALDRFDQDVKSGTFPGQEESY